jgi:stage II sporulation protein D
MRRMLYALTGAGLALAASAAAGPRAPAPAPAKPAAVTATAFVVSGRGWGHGVGMSQYGALGFANDGWSYDRILTHFYRGVELGPAALARVRVLVAEGAKKLTIRSASPFRVRDVFGKTYPLEPGAVVLGPKLRVAVAGTPTDLPGPLLFLPGTTPLELDGPYRGQLAVSVAEGKLDAVNVLGLEPYLQGVVAQEMPSAWPEEALKAQAVAARSYALAHLIRGKHFDVYADVRSQVYGGIRGEHPRTTAAVQATKGQVLLWEGKPADALFHSTSGGSTLDAAEVFGKAVPYLVAVDDPWSTLSPVHRWGPTTVAEATLRRALKLRAPVTALKLTRGASGRVVRVDVTAGDVSTRISGAELRRAGGLRSTWITQLATLSVTRPGGPVVFGKTIVVTGRAQGVKGARLQQLVDGRWTPIGGPGLKARLRPLVPARVRIAAGKLVGPVLKVPVAPLVSVRAQAGAVTGTVAPRAPGTAVQLQQDSEQGWLTLARTTTGPEGAYSFVPPEPGRYRVRVPPAAGFAEGLSATVELP